MLGSHEDRTNLIWKAKTGQYVLLQHRDFTDDEICQASSSLEANTDVIVRNGASVMFQSAGSVRLDRGIATGFGHPLPITFAYAVVWKAALAGIARHL